MLCHKVKSCFVWDNSFSFNIIWQRKCNISKNSIKSVNIAFRIAICIEHISYHHAPITSLNNNLAKWLISAYFLFLLFVNCTKKRYFMYLFFYYYGAFNINNSSYYPSVLLCIKTFIHFVKLAFVLSKCVHVEKILDAISFQYHNLLSWCQN